MPFWLAGSRCKSSTSFSLNVTARRLRLAEPKSPRPRGENGAGSVSLPFRQVLGVSSFKTPPLFLTLSAAVVLVGLGSTTPLFAQLNLDAYGGTLSLQCGPNSKAVTSAISTAARSSGTVTLTFTSPHRFIVNDTITVAGTSADGGSFNTPAQQLFTIASVPTTTSVTYSQSGHNVSPTSSPGSAALARYYTSKAGSRWWLCTPLGNAMWMNAVSETIGNSTKDYQNIINADVTPVKYTKGVTINGEDNWAYQTALRLKAWGFNTVAEDSNAHLFPTTTDGNWKTPDATIPVNARLPYITEPNPIIYTSYNQGGYAPLPTKNEKGLYKRVMIGSIRGMTDVFDANFSKWLSANLATGPIHARFTGPHHEYLLGFIGDESDTTGSLTLGSDFEAVTGGGTGDPGVAVLWPANDYADPQWGWMILISSPVEAAASASNTPYSSRDLVYSDIQYYSKSALSTWLQQRSDRGPGYASIGALNAAWGSNYDTFGSDAVSYTATCATGNGTKGPYNCTLTHTPVTPLSVQVKVGGALTAGDDGAGPEAKPATGTGNLRTNGATRPIGTITYASGAVSITFNTAVGSGTSISITYRTNGWGAGHGLLDEDGSCPARKSGQSCWVPTSPYWTAASVETQIEKDLDGVLYHFENTYFSTVKGDLEAAAPGYLYMPVDPFGGYGSVPRREVLEAAALSADILPFGTIPASDPTGVVTDQQARIDFIAQYGGDLPWINVSFLLAQADSYFPASQYPLTTSLTFSTQLERGQYYQTRTGVQLTTSISSNCNCSFAGTYPIVGQNWWGIYDDPSQKKNFGLVTLRDDPYDGKASTPNPGVDPWGYPTGCQGTAALPGPTSPCEEGSYGDALDSIITANALWFSYAAP